VIACTSVAILQIRTFGVSIAGVQFWLGALVHHLTAHTARSMVWTEVFGALVALATVAVFEVDALCVLMAVVQMRELALVNDCKYHIIGHVKMVIGYYSYSVGNFSQAAPSPWRRDHDGLFCTGKCMRQGCPHTRRSDGSR